MSSPSKNRSRIRHPESGAEILEFSFVLGALLALMLGIFSFARAYEIYETITRAAREGARMAALPSSIHDGNTFIDGASTYSAPNSTVFTDYIAPALRAANLSTSACTNSTSANCIASYHESVAFLDPSDPQPQCGVKISITYSYPLSIPFLGQSLGMIPIGTSVQMRRENQTGSCP